MRPLTRVTFPLLMACFLSAPLALSADAGEEGYRLLELDGYKVKWGDHRLGVSASVSYAFATEALRFDDARNCREIVPMEVLSGETLSMEAMAVEAAEAFRVWERAAGLSFHKVDHARDADIIIGAQGQPRGRAYANVSYAPDVADGVRTIEQALVCLNPEHQWKVGFDGDEEVYDIRYTLIHEIGHAIGLDHPGPSGQVMAFRYTEAFSGLQPGDLRGVQRLYGAGTGKQELASTVDALAPDGESVSISDLIVDRVGSIMAMIIGVGDFLAIGEKTTATDKAEAE